jgi:hypothetical protein
MFDYESQSKIDKSGEKMEDTYRSSIIHFQNVTHLVHFMKVFKDIDPEVEVTYIYCPTVTTLNNGLRLVRFLFFRFLDDLERSCHMRKI